MGTPKCSPDGDTKAEALGTLKMLLGIEDDSKDTLLSFLIDDAEAMLHAASAYRTFADDRRGRVPREGLRQRSRA